MELELQKSCYWEKCWFVNCRAPKVAVEGALSLGTGFEKQFCSECPGDPHTNELVTATSDCLAPNNLCCTPHLVLAYATTEFSVSLCLYLFCPSSCNSNSPSFLRSHKRGSLQERAKVLSQKWKPANVYIPYTRIGRRWSWLTTCWRESDVPSPFSLPPK